jgi:hypothetical protein
MNRGFLCYYYIVFWARIYIITGVISWRIYLFLLAEGMSKISRKRIASVGTASRVPRVTLALACSEGLYTLSHPVASSLIYIQHQPEHHTYLQLTVPLCYQQLWNLACMLTSAPRSRSSCTISWCPQATAIYNAFP